MELYERKNFPVAPPPANFADGNYLIKWRMYFISYFEVLIFKHFFLKYKEIVVWFIFFHVMNLQEKVLILRLNRKISVTKLQSPNSKNWQLLE